MTSESLSNLYFFFFVGQHVEASQSVQITWDDPTSRREKEKVMAQIKRTDNGHAEPEQHGEDAQQVEEQVMQVVSKLLSRSLLYRDALMMIM